MAILAQMLFAGPADRDDPARAVGQAATERPLGLENPEREMPVCAMGENRKVFLGRIEPVVHDLVVFGHTAELSAELSAWWRGCAMSEPIVFGGIGLDIAGSASLCVAQLS